MRSHPALAFLTLLARLWRGGCWTFLLALPLLANEPSTNKYVVLPTPEKLVDPALSYDFKSPLISALTNAERLFGSSNLISEPAQIASNGAKQWEENLAIARNQRHARQFEIAKITLLRVLESNAPDEAKRSAFIEMALVAQEENQLTRAQQMYAQFLTRWPDDANGPEILLRQGLIYRQMGLNTMALAKFYSVMTSALVLKNDSLEYYQRLVLQAQTEIAETHFLLGKYEESADCYQRLLRLEAPALNKSQIQYKLIRSFAQLNRQSDIISVALDFLEHYYNENEVPEVRFTLANAYKEIGKNQESLQQVLLLLKAQHSSGHLETLAYWQQRAGNEIANRLYQERDYARALEIYVNLSHLSDNADWLIPVWYQIGLVYERLEQPALATEYYNRILDREKELGAKASPGMKAIFDMGRWRRDFSAWQAKVEVIDAGFKQVVSAANAASGTNAAPAAPVAQAAAPPPASPAPARDKRKME